MLKNLLSGAAALGLMSQVAQANEIIINGQPVQNTGVVNVPYGHGGANCCATGQQTFAQPVYTQQAYGQQSFAQPTYTQRTYTRQTYTQPVAHSVQPATYQSAPVVTYEAAPEVVYDSAPVVSYETAPAVTYESAPITTYETVPATTYQTAPVTTYQTVPAQTYQTAPTETIINIRPAPAAVAPLPPVAASAIPVVGRPAPRPQGWRSQVYVGARGGYSDARRTDFDIAAGNVDNRYQNDGYNVAGVVGWGRKAPNGLGFRLEGEVGYQTADIDSHTIGGTRFDGSAFGETNTIYGFVNAFVDVPIFAGLNGVLGGGIGAGNVDFDNQGIRAGGIGRVINDDDTAFGYHLDAGMSYDVSDRLTLEAMYRYTSFVDVDLTADDGSKSSTDVDTQNVVVGARFGF